MSVHENSDLKALFAAQRAAFAEDSRPSLAARRQRLDRILALTGRHRRRIADAISADFGHRSPRETEMADIFAVLSGVRHSRRHLAGWMKSRRVATPLHLLPARSRLIRQPLGVVGVISPWNYPFQLAMLPAAAALAAGNRVMIKPSELTPSFSSLLAEIVAEEFSPDECVVVAGGVETGEAFSRLPFDHLLFTGSTAVGRKVALAAADALTPVTLELGGKSPVILDSGCDLTAAARRIAFGKLLNAGQTCVAPDYVLVPAAICEAFVDALAGAMRGMYPRLADNPDYSSIVSGRHYQRLERLIADAEAKGARVLTSNPAGETLDPLRRKLAPAILTGVTEDMAVMQEEIFGPILPVLSYDGLEQALAFVNARPRPLALYWFGDDGERRDRVLAGTWSGGVTVNDVIWHVCQDNLPFGGVGASGMGAYHGEHGFRTFSKEKPVLLQSRFNGLALFRPPYGLLFDGLLAILKRYF